MELAGTSNFCVWELLLYVVYILKHVKEQFT